jgi:hypothetical protein
MDMEGYTGKTCLNLQSFAVTKKSVCLPDKNKSF